MNGVFIIPTGVGCSIGGHAGDAVCAVNLIASQCDDLIVNPNAVNGSDLNEMAGNCLYVEGSTIDRFLQGEVGLEKRRRNRILLVGNAPLSHHTRNSVNAARVHLGVEIDVLELKTPLVLRAGFEEDGSAGGEVTGWRELLQQTAHMDFDALAVHTPIDVSEEVVRDYLALGGVNPWGGVEAKASRLIAEGVQKPVAHAPAPSANDPFKDYEGVPDPRMAAELVSVSYVHCVLKGLARAPAITTHDYPELDNGDVDFLITPDNCYGVPHIECRRRGIEIIVVRENKAVLDVGDRLDGCTFVDNYLEAAGVIACRRIGIGERAVRADG